MRRALRILGIALIGGCSHLTHLLADENAALEARGARVEVTCKHPKPLNDTWHKSPELLWGDRANGPIINDLTTAEITVILPMPMNVVKVGVRQGDYKGSFAIAKDAAIHAPGHEAKEVLLANAPDKVQFFDYAAKTDRVRLTIRSVYPPQDGPADRVYGGITQVQVIVSDDLSRLFAVPDGYAKDLPVFVMRTPNLDPQAVPEIHGQPRKSTGHPCTIWDKEDIRDMKAQIERYPAAREAYRGIITFCDKACAEPMTVPDEPDLGTNPKVANMHTAISSGIANLGIGYALSGEENYAREAKRLLLELAKRYESWPVHRHPNFTHDSSKWSYQRLGDALWLIPSAWGFDLIHESPSLNDEDRKTISDGFILPCVRNIMRYESIITAPTNWSAICAAAVMIGARVCGDQTYYEKSYLGLTRKMADKRGGFFFHLDKGIDDDGMWAEGAIGYQFMAIRGLLVMAEILWHDGIDAYGYGDGRLKKVFDSPIWYGYPGGRTSPAIHDSGSSDLFGRDAHLYQYARRRYGDATYNSILCKVTPTLESVFNLFLPACDFSPIDPANLPEVPSILFPGVGFAIARTGYADESRYLLLDYGPSRSHGHPDKLNFCLYALGQELFADAGSAWYDTDIYKRYYSHSVAHNTITANEVSQIMTSGRLEAYGSFGDLALIRASCDSAIPAAILDRTILLSGDRIYDLFGVLSGIPYTLDLPYHAYGTMEQTIATSPWTPHPADKPGYAYLKDPLAAAVDGNWTCRWKVARGHIDLHSTGEAGTQIIFGRTPKGGDEVPTAIVRRNTRQTTYGTAIDMVAEGRSPSIRSLTRYMAEGSQGCAIQADLLPEGTEAVMTNFSGGAVTFGPWRTDARAAFIRIQTGTITAFYLAGGTSLEGSTGRIASTRPALLALHTVKDGLAQIVNQSDIETAVEIRGSDNFESVCPLDKSGNRVSQTPIEKLQGSMRIPLKGLQTAELVRGDQPTVAEFTAERRRSGALAATERERREREGLERQVAEQQAQARSFNVPADYFLLVQAEAIADQGGGKVTVTDRKVGAFGQAFLNWDSRGHWLDYDVDIAREGLYQVLFKYCREGGPVTRSLRIDGDFPSDAAKAMEMPGTGGWSNGADNWALYTLSWPIVGKPFLVQLKAGKHRIRLENVSGDGLNLDYIVLAAPFLQVTRDLVEK